MLIRVKSLKGLKCDTRSLGSYNTLIGTFFTEMFFHAVRTITSISNSNLLVKKRLGNFLSGYARYPDWVSVSLIPVSNQNQKLENRLPKLLFLGTLSCVMFRLPIKRIGSLVAFNSSKKTGISSG